MIAGRQSSDYEFVHHCLFCGSQRSEPVFDLSWAPVCWGRFAPEQYQDRVGRLYIHRCLD